MGLKKEQIKFLSDKYTLDENKVEEIVNSLFIFINKKSEELNIIGNETKEEFIKKTFNYNIPYIGKLYANYYKFLKIHKK